MVQTVFLSVAGMLLLAPAAPPPAFVKTLDSDAWVRASFVVQPSYARVLVVTGSGRGPKTVRVPALDLNARLPGASQTLAVSQVFTTVQAAVDAAHGGDLVAVLPGRYAGFVMGPKDDAGDGRYIHVKALGRPGDVTIDRPGADPDWMVLFQAAHHAILEGFNIAGATGPGLRSSGRVPASCSTATSAAAGSWPTTSRSSETFPTITASGASTAPIPTRCSSRTTCSRSRRRSTPPTPPTAATTT